MKAEWQWHGTLLRAVGTLGGPLTRTDWSRKGKQITGPDHGKGMGHILSRLHHISVLQAGH